MIHRLKGRFAVIALAAILLTLLTQQTQAYYSATGKATNVVTSGSIRFLIHETTDQGMPFPTEGVYILPGDVVSKQVRIESDCGHPFYLRVKILYGVDDEALTAEDCFKLNIDETNWQYHDGWYYYTDIVDPGETTPNVFSHVEIVGSKVDSRYIGKTLTLTVKAQAVQSENNPITDDDTYTAAGWPQE